MVSFSTASMSRIDGFPPIRHSSSPSRSDWAKRALDLVVGFPLFVMALPVIILAMVLVRLTSKGPAIYRQVRLGRFGRPFEIYKIRSMTHNCELHSGIQWSSRGDARVTTIGRILRKTHVDELPQLVNVLRGEMSLVGPRPERPEIICSLETAIPHYRDRLMVLPGLTGLAQVQLPPDTDLDSVRRKLRVDRHYVASGSLWLDVRLMAATALHVLGCPFTVSQVVFAIPGERDLDSDRRPFVAAPHLLDSESLVPSMHLRLPEAVVDATRA